MPPSHQTGWIGAPRLVGSGCSTATVASSLWNSGSPVAVFVLSTPRPRVESRAFELEHVGVTDDPVAFRGGDALAAKTPPQPLTGSFQSLGARRARIGMNSREGRLDVPYRV